jgi:hypothetical protein
VMKAGSVAGAARYFYPAENVLSGAGTTIYRTYNK